MCSRREDLRLLNIQTERPPWDRTKARQEALHQPTHSFMYSLTHSLPSFILPFLPSFTPSFPFLFPSNYPVIILSLFLTSFLLSGLLKTEIILYCENSYEASAYTSVCNIINCPLPPPPPFCLSVSALCSLSWACRSLYLPELPLHHAPCSPAASFVSGVAYTSQGTKKKKIPHVNTRYSTPYGLHRINTTKENKVNSNIN